ncbi:hypothetical protein Vadar_024713 [Vaccinium darrowii]|uniref:Uncharacterized protein n=1 Tax=Vaccinium darrowii TaxID=229202 RepID=A0ACB7Y913_9ERIC|nr:hypothetical protein Vadar_024713 [Vaccinium darrowii]
MKLSSHSLPSSSSSIMLFSVSVLLIFSCICTIITTEAIVTLPKNIVIPAVIVFGDSIVDQGNNNNLTSSAKSNFPPYGKDFMGGIPTGRFSNGKTPPDLVAEDLGVKDLLPAYLDPSLQATDLLTGVSFASGGTGFDPQSPQIAAVYTLDDQLKMFKEYIGKLKGMVGEDRTNFILTNSLYLVVAGSNDLTNTYFLLGIRRLQYDIDSYTDFMVRSASNFVKVLPSSSFIIYWVKPILSGKLFNAKITGALSSLSNSLNDAQVRIVYIDIYNPILDLIQNHREYGFAVADKGCCGSGTIEAATSCNALCETCSDDSQYVFWDSFHPTERAYKVLVNYILQKYIKDFL